MLTAGCVYYEFAPLARQASDWPPTATAGISTGHILIIAEKMCFKADAFTHTMTSYLRKRERESGIAEEEGGRGLKEVLMSIIGSARGSL